MDECYELANPCEYGGTCINLNGTHECICVEGRMGKTCGDDVDECALYQPCRNGGTCVNTDGSYTCFCDPGWQGKNCTIGTVNFLNLGTTEIFAVI